MKNEATHVATFLQPRCSSRKRFFATAILAALLGTAFPVLCSPLSEPSLQDIAKKLRSEIAAEPASNSSPIETVMARYEDKTGIDFNLSWARTEEDDTAKPLIKPEQLSDDDWKAFLLYWNAASNGTDLTSENQSASFTFVDLNEDGQRDLIMYYYIGGTGLFSQVEFAQRDIKLGFQFVTPKDQDGYPASYSINGRGADQAIYYLRIDGRSYVAYRDGVYAEDVLTINRPLLSSLEQEALTTIVVSYRYKHKAYIPGKDTEINKAPLTALLKADPKSLQAANQQLQRLSFDAKGQQTNPDPTQPCPSKKTSTEEDETWPWRTAGHYTFDYVADFRVKTSKACYSASIIAYKNSYMTSREHCCSLWLKSSYATEDIEFPLTSIRMPIRVELR